MAGNGGRPRGCEPAVGPRVEDLEFDETKTYVKRVMENYARYRQLYEKLDRPSLPK